MSADPGLLAFYPQVKWVHVAAVATSGSLFLLRGAGTLAGARWPLSLPLRWLAIAVDTVLLTAALMLLTILPWAMFANGWLATKLSLLVAYVALATYALRRGRTRAVRACCYAAALLTFAFMLSVARAHHPLGALAWWHGG